MKLADFTTATDRDYDDLKGLIDELPDRRAQAFDCELPPDCLPQNAEMCFFKPNSNNYAMYLSGDIKYSGNIQTISLLCSGQQSFQTFDEMKSFLRSLPADEPESQSEIPTVDDVTDMSMLSLPADTVQTVPDRKAIQRELEKIIMGQDEAVETIAHQVSLHLKKKNPKKPLSIVTYGPPGTGKSELAKALSKVLLKLGSHQFSEVWTDLNQFTEAHSVYRLLGSPPGYVGYEDTPAFEAVTQNPYTVFIWDELDKAHEQVLKTFMAILDEGRCAARKEQADHSREYDFRHCIFIFTSNHRLGTSIPQQKIGFSMPDIIRSEDNAVEIGYPETASPDEHSELTKRIYRNTESARKAFVESGVLREIASRFNCFVEFKEFSAEAKIRILVKQVIETGFEYNIRLSYISPGIMQELINASGSENAMTVRSFKSVIEGYLATAFAEASSRFSDSPVRLGGSLELPEIAPL